MTTTRWISLVGPSGKTLAARLYVNDEGEAVFEPGEEFFDQVIRKIGNGVYSNEEKRGISTKEGEAFVRAVDQMLARSSQMVVDDVEPSQGS